MRMEKARITGPMERYLKENGSMARKKGTACGKDSMETAMSANGKTIRLTDMAFTRGRTETSMRGNGRPL